MSDREGIESIEKDEQYELIIITLKSGSNAVIDYDEARDVFHRLGELLGIDWHT